jgi:hypothetical protein
MNRMFEIGLYLFTYYALGVVFYLLIKTRFRRVGVVLLARRARLFRRTVSGLFTVLLLFLPILPYVIVEFKTFFYKDEILPAVRNALREIGSSEEIFSLKVLLVSRKQAVVYVVTPCTQQREADATQYVAETIELLRTHNSWEFAGEYSCIWSDCGNADGNVFPPYPSGSAPFWLRKLIR